MAGIIETLHPDDLAALVDVLERRQDKWFRHFSPSLADNVKFVPVRKTEVRNLMGESVIHCPSCRKLLDALK